MASTIGEVRTYVHTGSTLNVDAWFEQLKRGRTFVSNGPFLEFTVNGQLPGTEIIARPGDVITIRARVASHPAIALPKVAVSLVPPLGIASFRRGPQRHPATSLDSRQA